MSLFSDMEFGLISTGILNLWQITKMELTAQIQNSDVCDPHVQKHDHTLGISNQFAFMAVGSTLQSRDLQQFWQKPVFVSGKTHTIGINGFT